MFDKASFRAAFPEFADTARYPDAMLDFWAGIGERLMFPQQHRWDTVYDYGLQLFVAHNITLAAQNVAASGSGGVPGSISGPTTSKAVGSVSVSYDAASSIEPNAGHWNLTTYGKMLIHLARMIGAGGIQI